MAAEDIHIAHLNGVIDHLKGSMKLIEDVAREICSALGENPNAADRKNGQQPVWMRYEEAAKAAIIVCGSYFAPDSKR